MTHDIPEETLNSNLKYCIREYVRQKEHRKMLREKWFDGMTLEQISAKHNICLTRTKEIIYGEGDKILLKASAMSEIATK